jgi:hypothetical protein
MHALQNISKFFSNHLETVGALRIANSGHPMANAGPHMVHDGVRNCLKGWIILIVAEILQVFGAIYHRLEVRMCLIERGQSTELEGELHRLELVLKERPRQLGLETGLVVSSF